MPRTDFFIKEGDTMPAIEARLLSDGEPVDLTDAYVVFNMEHISQDTQVQGQCTVEDDPEGGNVAYIWKNGDTDESGTYEAEFLVDYDYPESLDEFEADESFPPDRLLRIEISRGL